MKKLKVVKKFDTDWVPVRGEGQRVSYDQNIRYYRTDLKTGKDIDNDEIHGVKNDDQQSRLTEGTLTGA